MRDAGLALCVLAALLVGCDSSDDSDPTDGRDTSGDAGLDVPDDDTTPDADTGPPDVDATPDVDTTPDADTEVPDTTPDVDVGPDVPPLDCDPLPRCETDADCTAPLLCTAGVCNPPLDPQDTTVQGTFYRVTGARLANADGPLGLDQDGDGQIDNLLGRLITSLPGGQALVEREVNSFLRNDILTLGVDVVTRPGLCGEVPGTDAAQVLIYGATRDLDGDGLTAAELDDATTLRLRASTFDGERGPNCAMLIGSLDAASQTVTAQGGLRCDFPVTLFDGATLNLPLRDVRVQIVPNGAEKDGTGATATLGGSVRVRDLVDEANQVGPDCACAGIDTAQPVAETLVQGDRVSGRCIQDVRGASACDENLDGRTCTNLPALCSGLILLGAQTDISTGDDGPLKDALSFGLEADLTPTELADPPVGPALQAFGDHWETNQSLQIRPATLGTRIAPLANDEYDPDQDRLQAVGEVEPTGLPVTLTQDGNNVRIDVEAGWPTSGTETFSFSYTIGDGDTRASTATVTMRAIARTPMVQTVPDTYTVLLPVEAPVPLRVLDNDTPPTDAAWGLSELDAPARGTAAIEDNFTVLYTPPATAGPDSFTYRVLAFTDLGRESLLAPGTVDITVDCQPGYWGSTCTPCETCVGGTCDDGAEGDGACVDTNECDDSPCGAEQSCENTVGSFTCSCPTGYTVNGLACDDLNECEEPGGDTLCGDNEVCRNTVGTFECPCLATHYRSVDGRCLLDDVCSTDPCDPVEEQCAIVLEEPGYVCVPAVTFDPGPSVTSNTDHPGVEGFGATLDIGGDRVIIGDEEADPSASSTWVLDIYAETEADALDRFLGIPTPLVAADPFGEGGLLSGRTGFPVQYFGIDFDPETFLLRYIPTFLLAPNDEVLEGFATALDFGAFFVAVGRQPAGEDTPGTVELYENLQGTFLLSSVLSRPDGTGADGFGAQVAVGFQHVLVSAPQAGPDGEVWIFARDDGGWFGQSLDVPEAARGARFGAALALEPNGRLAYVAAPDATVRGRAGTGLVAVYAETEGTWGLIDLVVPAVAVPAQRFGDALGADESTLVVGAPGFQEDRGRVYVFDAVDESEGTGAADYTVTFRGEIANPWGPGARFGNAVSISFGLVAVGAPGVNRVDLFSLFSPE